jgi:hypothetical protein
MRKDIDFSFIMPSRGNKELLQKTLDSFERTTRNKDRLEFLILFDIGTAEDVPNFIRSLKYSFDIKFYYREHSLWWTKDYFNFLANRTSGRNICAFNDDAWMRTQNWDVKILDAIKDSGWSIYGVDVPDTARIKYRHNFPCFPMVSRKAMATLGFFFHEQVKIYPADQVLHGLYSEIKRVLKVDDVLIQHDHIMESDDSKSKFMEVFRKQKENGELNIDISVDAFRLLREASKDANRKPSKLKRIINVLKEPNNGGCR